MAVCVARSGGAKRAAPVFSFYKALFDLVGDARLQARASGNLGAAECLAGRLDVGLRWHTGSCSTKVYLAPLNMSSFVRI